MFLLLHKKVKLKIQCRLKRQCRNKISHCFVTTWYKIRVSTCSNTSRHPEFWLLNEKLKLPRAQNIAATKGPQKAVNIICMLRVQQATLSHSFQTDAATLNRWSLIINGFTSRSNFCQITATQNACHSRPGPAIWRLDVNCLALPYSTSSWGAEQRLLHVK